MKATDALRIALVRIPPPADFDAYHAAVMASLDEQGYLILARDAYELLAKVAESALVPTGEHRLINGYCPDCQGGCMLGFGAEEVQYVEPSPIEPKP